MKVLITGSEGFIGSHLVEKLVKKKAKVTALVKYNYQSDLGWLDKNLIKNIDLVFGDIEDLSLMNKLTSGKDVVVNLAALISIPYSYNSTKSYINTNILGTYNILEASKHNKIKKIILTSTSEVYGSARYVPIDEKHILQPQSPYSATKIASDQLGLSYYYSFNLPVTIARPFNTFGPRQSTRAVIPTIITQMLSKSKSIKIGDVSTKRDFSYVEDTAEFFIKLIYSKKNLSGEVINYGSGYSITIKKLYEVLKKITNSKVKLSFEKKRFRPQKSEVKELLCDNRRAIKLLGIKKNRNNELRLISGLKKTFEWYSKNENLKKFRAGEYNF